MLAIQSTAQSRLLGDKDGCLSPAELQNLFSVCATQPWNQDALNSAETNEQGWLTYNGYLSNWVLTTFLDVPRTLEYLAYLGFNARHANQLSAISIMRDRRIDIQEKHTTRTVFQCHVIGPKDVGKTAFVQSFVGRNLKQVAALNRRQLTPYTINSVQVQDQQKYLLLHEVDVFSPDDPLTLYEKSADVICLIYDVSNPTSFEYCAQIFKKYFNRMKVPCLMVATKADRREVLQQYELQPAEFCQKHRLPQPIRFLNSDLGRPTAEVYTKLATMAVYPHLKQVYFLHDSSIWTKVTLGAAAAALIGFLIF
uniref:Miro domain-containing protein n=1 Tax=Plectus sambesii TaxID=2011161 RepID=A0A914UQK5_9BILA